jgi:hypothetical protein
MADVQGPGRPHPAENNFFAQNISPRQTLSVNTLKTRLLYLIISLKATGSATRPAAAEKQGRSPAGRPAKNQDFPRWASGASSGLNSDKSEKSQKNIIFFIVLCDNVTGTKILRRNQSMAATQPIRCRKQIRRLVGYYLRRGRIRDYTFIVLGLHTALRISDLLLLTWDDVYDFEKQHVRANFSVSEKKTGKTKTIALNAAAIKALTLFARRAARKGRFLMVNWRTKMPITRIQAYRIIREAAEASGIGRASCHSLRKTFGYFAWRAGVSPAVIMEIYNHSSLEVTRRYLGVTQDDKNEVYLNMKLL